MGEDTLFRLENLTVHFKAKGRFFSPQIVHALDGVSFRLKGDETLGLVGETGSGKSTIARTLIKLVEPTGGRIYYDGTPLENIKNDLLKRFRKEVQMVFQDPYESLFPRHTIRKILETPLRVNRIVGREEYASEITDMLEMVRLDSSVLDKRPKELSGGMRQRVSIARALAVRPKFVILDEPVSMLDVSIKASIINLLSDLKKERRIAYLYISHDLASAKYISDRLAILYLGKIAEIGTPEELLESPSHPYTKLLLDSIFDIKRAASSGTDVLRYGEIGSTLRPPSGCRFHPRCPFATQECRESEPPEVRFSDTHSAACFHPVGR